LAIEQIMQEAGFPEGVFQTLLVHNEGVEALIASEAVQAVTLTGSERAGSAVAATAGKYLKKTVLELGGSDPFVVLPDADLAYTAQQAAAARMNNTGQSCICAKRFIVPESIADEFVAKLKAQLQTYTLGDPLDETTKAGPLARPDLADGLLQQVQDSVAKGAKVALGGNRPDRPGAFFEPTILLNVQSGQPAYHEELFGPVASVLVVKNEEEAVRVANDTNFGLGASVWTRDPERGEALARQLEAGMVFVNEVVRSDSRVPFGGIKRSGYGRELSYLGMREFMNAKTVWVK
jgi:succinate-semialdehyde dehydrogenase/glutarate-semialdehyde dehydrogenase